MAGNWLQLVAESGVWKAFCQTPAGSCQHVDCTGNSEYHGGTQALVNMHQLLIWPPGSCSVHAITCAVQLLFLLIWLGKGLYRFLLPVNAQNLQSKAAQRQKHSTHAVLSRARAFFIASILLSALLFLSYFVLGVLDLVSRWVTKGSNPPMHIEVTTWILAASWLVLTTATNSVRVEKESRIPMLIGAWWTASFLLSLLSLFPNISSYQSYHHLTSMAWVETVSLPVTAFLVVVVAFGKTGVINADDSGLNEPLLQEANGEAVNGEASNVEDDPGVTPYSTASLWSLLSISWINPILAAGYKKPVELTELPYADPGDRAECNYSKLKRNWEKQIEKDPTKPPSLTKALVMSFWWKAATNTLLAFACTVGGYAGPYLIDDFVEYLAGRRRFPYEGYVLVLGFGLAQVVETFAGRMWYIGMQFLGQHFNGSMTALLYRKGLRLSSQSRKGHTTGEIINYVAVDCQRISEMCYYFGDIFNLPFQLLLALLILYKVVGIAAISALVASLLVMLGNLPLARLQDSFQDKLMGAKDKRMKALTESLRSMQILKLQGWETNYLKKIEELRNTEYKFLRGSQYTNAALVFLFWTAPMFVSVATFGTCMLLGIPLTAGRILSALATFRVLQEPIIQLPDLISTLSQTKVSLERLDKYLKEEELQEDAVIHSPIGGEGSMSIEIDGADFKWDPSEDIPILKNINLHVKKGQRVAICGTVGSGKSTLLSSILGEISRTSGSVKVNGTTAYVAQTAWIQSGKIEENVLFGDPMDRSKYEETLRVCALEKDIEMFAYGDQTVIGERGINMSGGQKQRIQLARAVFQDADIYLLDDPFSAVDAHTGSELFRGCVCGALGGKTVLYVTHQVEFLPAADLIVVMRDGKIVQAGKYDELLRAGTDFSILVSAHNEAIDLVSSTSGYSKDEEEENGEDSNEDEEAVNGEDDPAQIVQQLSRNLSRKLSKKTSKETDEDEVLPLENKRQLVEEEERMRGNTSAVVYWIYISAVYKGALIPVILIAQVGFQGLQLASNYWMAWATPATEGEEQKVGNKQLIVVYCILALGTALLISIRAVLLSTVGLLTAQKFFMNMLRAIFRAPMSFFDSTPTGRILSRASSDQNALDDNLPRLFGMFLISAIQLLCIIAIMCQITWKLLFLFVPVSIACVAMQRYYIKTARELKRLMEVLRAPILHHYGESITGAATIRGFGQKQRFLEKQLQLYDKYARAAFHNFCSTQWLMFRMEVLTTIVFTVALIYAIQYMGIMDPGIAGLAVTYGLQLNNMQTLSVWIIGNLENRIISVERIMQFTRIKSEAPLVIEDSRPSKEWPIQGTIDLHDLRVRYNDHSPYVLHGLTCKFAGGQKIGIVGRTGSGKSTLIQTLFRIVEPSGGSIVIDGIDILKIGLHDLRSKLSIIPQDPTLFEGTVRANLDPLQQYSDAEIWEALEKCQLGDVIRAKEEKLDSPVNEDGENWSVGQRQLVCLGRALLKKTTILVLDEATASVDTATDGVIQQTLRTEFRECTVITVAHRIPTIIDSDKALVLADGKIAEYDAPIKLLGNKNSLFYKLVSEYSSRSKSVTDLSELEG
ncbi:unnamed protein product [Calypogeia fissa]